MLTAQGSTLTASDWASILVTFDEVDMPVSLGTASPPDLFQNRHTGPMGLRLHTRALDYYTDIPAVISDVTIVAPVALATAAALTPTLLATVLPGVSTATAQALAPNLLATVLPAAATATAAALAPTLRTPLLPAAATATAAALTPTLIVTILPAAATATAQALVPAVIVPIIILAPVATATAAALTPTLIAATLPGSATATAAALTPTLKTTILPAAATATAAGLVPTLKVTVLPSAATATATALAPAIIIGPVTIAAPAATATAAALTPVLKVTILPGSATATAAALIPTISGLAALGTTLIRGQISHELRTPGLLGQLHGQLRNVIAVSTVRGYYTFSTSYATGGETPNINIQRVVVQVLFAKLAGGKGITWNGTKLSLESRRFRQYHHRGHGGHRPLIRHSPMIVYVIAH